MAISLNDHEKRIKDFDGKIVDLGDRITELEGRPIKEWVIETVTFTNYNVGGVFQYWGYLSRDYTGWDWSLINARFRTERISGGSKDRHYGSISDGKTISASGDHTITVNQSVSINKNRVDVWNLDGNLGTKFTILFYK